ADQASGAALFEIDEKEILIGCSGGVSPAFVSFGRMRLARNHELVGDQVLIAGSFREDERREVFHLCAGVPLEGVPHLDRGGRLDISAPNALGSVYVTRESS